MHPLDIELRNLNDCKNFLEIHKNLIASAVAFPNKQIIEKFINPNMTSNAGFNVIKKDFESFSGRNYDGQGAIDALKKHLGLSERLSQLNNTYYIFGTGSTAMSFQASLVSEGISHTSIFFITSKHSFQKSINLSSVISPQQVMLRNDNNIYLINATPLGSKDYPSESPFDNLSSSNFFKKCLLVYDFNYGVPNSGPNRIAHEKTIQYLDGDLMNLFQASASLHFALGSRIKLESSEILSIMQAGD